MSDDKGEADKEEDTELDSPAGERYARAGASSKEHPSEAIHCPVCGQTYYSMDAYIEHSKRVHKK
jgi:hypothetical protein